MYLRPGNCTYLNLILYNSILVLQDTANLAKYNSYRKFVVDLVVVDHMKIAPIHVKE